MTNKIILLFTILTYSFIVSQSFMYIFALKNVQLSLEADSYIEFRKLIDAGMRNNFKYAVYAALIMSLLLIVSTIKNPGSLLFIMSVLAFAALVTDTIITVKGNLPINDIINGWSATDFPANWTEYRTKWLQLFQYRQIVNIFGFICLLFGAVFGQHN